MFGFNRNPKRYEAPSEYTPPSAEELASEYVFERKKPDVPVDFGAKLADAQKQVKEEDKQRRNWKLNL